ncbi:MAG: M23 family metallopeptidase [Saprospiraceae bacterium]|nr:M23 family metallopeptidase [Saprospiraceae bacterium]
MSKENKKSWFYWMDDKYRMVLMNDETFQENRSFRLSPSNVISLAGLNFLVVGVFVILLMILTPLGNLIPQSSTEGKKGDNEIREALFLMNQQLDSLQTALNNKDEYIASLSMVVMGEHETVDDATKAYEESKATADDKPTASVPEKSDDLEALIESVENEAELGNLVSDVLSENISVDQMQFIAPIKGIITDSFAPSREHYGTDIVAPKGTVIKSIQKGTVIVATWSADTGHMIGIQHDNRIISFYKHNSALLKKTGDRIDAGEAIAIIGNTGEMTDGTHLHFELWYNRQAVNPQHYIAF